MTQPVPTTEMSAARGTPSNLLTTWWQLRRDPIAFFADRAARIGPSYRFRLGVRDVHVLGDAESVRAVLQDPALFTKAWAYDKVRPVLGAGLLTNAGAGWQRQRRLLQPAFHGQRLQGYAEAVEAVTTDALDEWVARGETLDLTREMMTLTLRIVGRTLFGVDVRRDIDGIGDAMTTLLDGALRRIVALSALGERIPTRENLAFARAARHLDEVVYRMIDERRRAPNGRADILTDLLEARDDAGEGLTDAQIRDEVLTLLVAGHETTASVLAWTFYLLSRHPHVFRRVHAEAREGRAWADLGYTRATLEETMRLYPPGWILARQVSRPTRLERFDLREGSIVAICPYLLHRDVRYWQNPEGFDPDRFAEGSEDARRRFVYVPFSAGPRACIGRAFSMMEMQIVVSTIARRYALDLVPTRRVEVDAKLTLRAKDGIHATLRAV